jgi:hypothetical protein
MATVSLPDEQRHAQPTYNIQVMAMVGFDGGFKSLAFHSMKRPNFQ